MFFLLLLLVLASRVVDVGLGDITDEAGWGTNRDYGNTERNITPDWSFDQLSVPGRKRRRRRGWGTGPLLLYSAVCSLSAGFFFSSSSLFTNCKQALIFIIHNTTH